MSVATLFFSSLSKTVAPTTIPFIEYIFPKMLLMGFLVLPLILIDSRDKVLLFVAIAINLSCVILVDSVNKLFGVELDFDQVSFENFERINFLILFPIVVILVGFHFLNRINISYEKTIINQNNKLTNANSIVEKFNDDLTTSIEYAKYIQQAILPRTHLLENWFADSFIYYNAKTIVSGDFYFFKESALNGKKCIVVAAADCTGHGVPGGFMSVLGMSLLNEIVREDNFTDAANILNQMRARLKEALNQSDEYADHTDGIELALFIYYPENNSLEFSGAKNPLYIISELNEVNVLKGNSMPIGLYLKEKPFTNVEVKLKGNEMCYLFTDGVLNQLNKQRGSLS